MEDSLLKKALKQIEILIQIEGYTSIRIDTDGKGYLIMPIRKGEES